MHTHISMSSAPATCNYIHTAVQLNCLQKLAPLDPPDVYYFLQTVYTALLHLLLYQYIVTILSTEWLNTDMV